VFGDSGDEPDATDGGYKNATQLDGPWGNKTGRDLRRGTRGMV